VVGSGGSALSVDSRAVPVHGETALIGVLFVLSVIEDASGRGQVDPAGTREKALAQLSTSLAHRVRNNVQALLGLLDQLSGCEEAEGTLSVARGLVADSAEDLRRFFVAASRGESGVLRPVRLGPLLERWVESATPGLPARVRISLRREALDDRVAADAEQITLWLDVSLSAALSNMELGGAVEVEVSEGVERESVRLTFSDTGSSTGSASLAGERQPFSSRQTARALAELVAARLGGRSGEASGSGLRNRVWIELHRVGQDLAEGEIRPSTPRSGAVLLADDEEMVRMSLSTALRGAGYEVVEARNGLEAVEKVLSSPERFALVVLDLVMPVMDGREALRRLRESVPALPVVICTGYDPRGDDVLAAAAVLIKPFSIATLLDKVAEFTAQPPAGDGIGGNISQ
jgi:CheY-like chemotaxis protein